MSTNRPSTPDDYGVKSKQSTHAQRVRGAKRTNRREPCEFCGRPFQIGNQMRAHIEHEHPPAPRFAPAKAS